MSRASNRYICRVCRVDSRENKTALFKLFGSKIMGDYMKKMVETLPGKVHVLDPFPKQVCFECVHAYKVYCDLFETEACKSLQYFETKCNRLRNAIQNNAANQEEMRVLRNKQRKDSSSDSEDDVQSVLRCDRNRTRGGRKAVIIEQKRVDTTRLVSVLNTSQARERCSKTSTKRAKQKQRVEQQRMKQEDDGMSSSSDSQSTEPCLTSDRENVSDMERPARNKHLYPNWKKDLPLIKEPKSEEDSKEIVTSNTSQSTSQSPLCKRKKIALSEGSQRHGYQSSLPQESTIVEPKREDDEELDQQSYRQRLHKLDLSSMSREPNTEDRASYHGPPQVMHDQQACSREYQRDQASSTQNQHKVHPSKQQCAPIYNHQLNVSEQHAPYQHKVHPSKQQCAPINHQLNVSQQHAPYQHKVHPSKQQCAPVNHQLNVSQQHAPYQHKVHPSKQQCAPVNQQLNVSQQHAPYQHKVHPSKQQCAPVNQQFDKCYSCPPKHVPKHPCSSSIEKQSFQNQKTYATQTSQGFEQRNCSASSQLHYRPFSVNAASTPNSQSASHVTPLVLGQSHQAQAKPGTRTSRTFYGRLKTPEEKQGAYQSVQSPEQAFHGQTMPLSNAEAVVKQEDAREATSAATTPSLMSDISEPLFSEHYDLNYCYQCKVILSPGQSMFKHNQENHL